MWRVHLNFRKFKSSGICAAQLPLPLTASGAKKVIVVGKRKFEGAALHELSASFPKDCLHFSTIAGDCQVWECKTLGKSQTLAFDFTEDAGKFANLCYNGWVGIPTGAEHREPWYPF